MHHRMNNHVRLLVARSGDRFNHQDQQQQVGQTLIPVFTPDGKDLTLGEEHHFLLCGTFDTQGILKQHLYSCQFASTPLSSCLKMLCKRNASTLTPSSRGCFLSVLRNKSIEFGKLLKDFRIFQNRIPKPREHSAKTALLLPAFPRTTLPVQKTQNSCLQLHFCWHPSRRITYLHSPTPLRNWSVPSERCC